MKVDIWLKDAHSLQENEDLGIEVNKNCYELVPLNFVQQDVTAYWVDPGIDPATDTRDICFFVAGVSYRTPHTDTKEQEFKSIIENNIKRRL